MKTKNSKNKLLKAKETINLRRKFTEKIINEVSSAIIYIDLNNKILLMNKKTEDFLGADAKKDFFSVNSSISSEINKFKKNSILDQKVIQIKHLISGKLKILNLNLSKIYENKIFKGVLLSIDDITELISAQKKCCMV